MAVHQWRRVIREITAALDSGEFKPGDRLPTLALMGRRWGASAAVVTTACDHLTADGVLHHQSHGSYYAVGPGQAPEPAASGQAPVFLTVVEVAAQARLSKATIHRLIENNTIRAVRIGSNRRIYADSWYAYLNGSPCPAGNASPFPPGSTRPVPPRSPAALTRPR